MPSIRNLPKWLAFLVPLTLALAMLPAVGCGGNNSTDAPPPPEPPKPDITTLSGLSISHGTMTPAFSPGVTNYGTTLYAEPSGFSVTATATDPLAKLSLSVSGRADVPMEQGHPAVVPIAEGLNTVRVIVEAQDGTKAFTTVMVDRLRANTKVWVLNSTMGGSYVEDTRITLRDAGNKVIQDNIPLPPEKNGTLTLALDPSQKYNIYASGKNSAEACFANFDRSREDTVVLYAAPGWLAGYIKAAPEITKIEFAPSASSGDWLLCPPGENFVTNTRANLAWVRVTALGLNPIASLADNLLDGISVDVDNVATIFSPYYNTATTCTPVLMNGRQYYELVFTANLNRIANGNPNADHFLSVAATDLAFNRTERRIFLKVTDLLPNQTSDTDLSDVVPFLRQLQAQTYGLPMYFPGITPVEGYGSEYYNYIAWRAGATSWSGNRVRRGYEVWRSDDNATWSKVITVNETGATNMTTTTEVNTADRTPGIVENTTYYYKVRMFNGNPANGGYSQFSNVMPIKFMPAFTTYLQSPAQNEVVSTLWPVMKFRHTNPAMLELGADPESTPTHRFFFAIGLRDVTGEGNLLWDVRMMMQFVRTVDGHLELALDEEGNPLFGYRGATAANNWYIASYPANPEDPESPRIPWIWMEDDGTIAIDTNNPQFDSVADYWTRSYRYDSYDGTYAPYYLRAGRVYEWSIFGQQAGIVDNHIPTGQDSPLYCAFCNKTYDPPAGTPTTNGAPDLTAYSMGGRYDYGYGSPNGWFTLITADDAK